MRVISRVGDEVKFLFFESSSDRDGQTMLWAIFHVLPIKLKSQWAIISKFNIAISVVNGPFFC